MNGVTTLHLFGHVVTLRDYAAFVWPSYGLSAIALVASVALTLERARRWRRRAESPSP